VDLAQARVRLSYNLHRGTFRVARLHNSIRLSRMATVLTLGGRAFTSTDAKCANKMVRRDPLRMIVRSAFRKGPVWETQFEIRTHSNEGNPPLDRALRDAYGVAVTCRLVSGSTTEGLPRFSLVGMALTEQEAFACRLAPPPTVQSKKAGYQPVPLQPVLQIAGGDAASGLNTSFYDSHVDCAVHLGAQQVAIGLAEPRTGGKEFPVRLDFESRASADFVEEFYKTVHGFACFEGTRRDFPPPPTAGWLDWYVTHGKTSESLILRNLDWLADNLRDYGLRVIQIDDGWQAAFADRLAGELGKKETDWLRANEHFPHGMAWLAEQIHAKEFLAGIWLVPYATNNAALVRDHPDWFLKGSDGKPQAARENWARGFGYVLDLANPLVERHYLAPLFKTLSSQWRYDYFKLDATGWTLLTIKDQKFTERKFARLKVGKKTMSGAEVVRDGLEAIRNLVGRKSVLACHAPCPELVGLVDAARVGFDMTPGWDKGVLHVFRETMDSFHTHGICWLNDPDCLVLRPLPVEQARVFVSMFGLTGQHLMLSDAMEELGEEKVEPLRRILPVCPTRALDLYPHGDAAAIWDLKLNRPFGSWDVVGVFNFEKQPAHRVLRFADLGLTSGAYVVYDFWNRRGLGRLEQEIALDLPPTACRVLAIHRETGIPQIVSTSRHITQGGVDLAGVRWNAKRNELSGRSLVVAGDPYELRLWVPRGYRPEYFTSSAPEMKLDATETPQLYTVRLSGHSTGEARWLIRFAK